MEIKYMCPSTTSFAYGMANIPLTQFCSGQKAPLPCAKLPALHVKF